MMHRLIALTLLGMASGGIASATSISSLFQGTFTEDDRVELLSFTADGSTGVTIQSYGYAGGTFDSTTIASGGFSPDAILFDDTGTEIASDSGGHCGVTGLDSITLECNDPYISEPSLAAGTYTLALVEYDNPPNDSLLADAGRVCGSRQRNKFRLSRYTDGREFCQPGLVQFDLTLLPAALRQAKYLRRCSPCLWIMLVPPEQ
jgi:hypothetical protein